MIDARLLLPAAGAWVGAAVVLVLVGRLESAVARHSLAVLLLCIVVFGGAVLVIFAVAVRGRPAARPALVAGGVLLSAAAVTSIWVLRMTTPPIASWIDVRATTVVEGVVTTEPEIRTSTTAQQWQAAAWVQVGISTRTVSARGLSVAVELPLVVRAPADARLPPPGSRISVTGRLAPTSLDRGQAGAVGAEGVRVLAAPGPVDGFAHAMRLGLREGLRGTDADAGALVAGLAVGDETLQSPALGDDMRATGLSHLTAVSGGNVAIVVGVVLLLATAVRLPLLLRALACAAALAFYVVLVGSQPSVLRAAAMGAVLLVGLVVGGARGGPPALGAAVVVLVHVWPWLALSWGFALSVVATAGLLLLAAPARGWLLRSRLCRRWPAVVVDAAALTLAAQLATAPVLVAMGGSVGWVSVPANLAAMPAVAPVTILGLASASLSPVAAPVAVLLAHLAAWPAGWIAWVAHTAARAPGVGPPVLPDGWVGLGLLVALLAALVGVRMAVRRWLGGGVPRSIRVAAFAALLTGGLVVATLPPGRRGWPPPDWLMIMCDVGQGDALLLRAGEGAAVVVDAGPVPADVDDCLDDAQVAVVPALVLTHFHADHVGGLAGVLDGRSVGAVLGSPIREPAAEAADVETVLEEHGLALTPVTAGDGRIAGDVEWRAVWPRRRISSGSVPNNASVVLVARIRDRTLLLAGDIEPEAQAAIAAEVDPLVLDVVKVPHHGSRYQDPAITTWARADVALISVGEGNDYGHPAPETVDDWERAGALVARTDLDGDVAVVRTPSGTGVVTRRDMLRSP